MSLNRIDFQTIADQLDALHIKDILNPKHPSYYFKNKQLSTFDCQIFYN